MTNKQIERGIRFLEESDHWDTIRDGLIKLLKAMLEPEEKKEEIPEPIYITHHQDRCQNWSKVTLEPEEKKENYTYVEGYFYSDGLGHMMKMDDTPIRTVYERYKHFPSMFNGDMASDMWNAIKTYCEEK